MMKRLTILLSLLLVAFVPMGWAQEEPNSLEEISFSTLPGEQVQLALKFSGPPAEPLSFTIDNPARIALDFANTINMLEQRTQPIGIGPAQSVTTAEAKGRTRVVINLAYTIGYQTEVVGNEFFVTLTDVTEGADITMLEAMAVEGEVLKVEGVPRPTVENVDFRRGENGEGRVIITLSNPNIPVDIREQAGRILLEFVNTALPIELERRLDVLDFATPVKSIDTFEEGPNVRMVILPTGDYEQLAYQSENIFTVELRPITKEKAEIEREKFPYSGDRLSLNFQDIEVRSVLQLIADFTGLNLIVSDTVSGNLTLRLKNVPWDQALDIILKTKGLAMRQTGNVILIAPSEEIAAREKLELEAQQAVRELAPLRSEFIQVNYANAADIANLLKAPENSLLSERGNVSIDERTNILLVQDTAAKLGEIRALVERLDIPVRQVLIEARVVVATDDFSKELGVRFGATGTQPETNGLARLGTGKRVGIGTGNLDGTTQLINGDPLDLENSLNVNLPVLNPAGSIGLALAKLPLGYLLELEISAAQTENRAEQISNPRVITSNQTKALIEQGVEIPFQEASSSGATSVSFKKAVLSLQVTPQITPDDRVFLKLRITKDSVGQVFNGVPSIDTQEVETEVLVDNGQTVVLGGIYEQEISENVTKVPLLGDLPIIGGLFRNKLSENDKSELLIFVTPKIISENLSLAP